MKKVIALFISFIMVFALAPSASAKVKVNSAPSNASGEFRKDEYGNYQNAFFMFGRGWWKDDPFKYSQVYGSIDTIENGGHHAKIWLIIDECAWTTGYEVDFEESLFDAGVNYGDILLMYCEAVEPYQEWKDGNITHEYFRAKCNHFDVLTKQEQEKIYSAITDFYD